MDDDRGRPRHRSVFGSTFGGPRPTVGPPLGRAPDRGQGRGQGRDQGLAPWRSDSGSWRYRPAWFQPARRPATQPPPIGAVGPPPSQRRTTVIMVVVACVLAVAVLLGGGVVLATRSGDGGQPAAAAPAPPAPLQTGTTRLSSESFAMTLPAGWEEQIIEPLGGGRPDPDERMVVGPNRPGLGSVVFVSARETTGTLSELAADELRSVHDSAIFFDIDGPRLRTVAGAQAAVLDFTMGQGPNATAKRRVLVLHQGRLFQLSLDSNLTWAHADRQAVDQMLGSWRWVG
jgi:hypothetical protein